MNFKQINAAENNKTHFINKVTNKNIDFESFQNGREDKLSLKIDSLALISKNHI